MFKRSLLALVCALCLALSVAAGEIPTPSGPTPQPTPAALTAGGEIPTPSLTDSLLDWLASIF